MQKVDTPRVIASTKSLTISGSVSIGGGPHRQFMYRLAIADLMDEDVVVLCEAMSAEVARRIRARWDELEQDSPLW